MKRIYLKRLKDTGRAGERIQINPKTYQWSYVRGFCTAIKARLRDMDASRSNTRTGGMDLAIRDIRDQARDAMYDDFPDLRPHPDDCPCESCQTKSKNKKALKPRYRLSSTQGVGAGSTAGASARIVTNDPKLGGQGKLSQ